jgi:hypothetical protein
MFFLFNLIYCEIMICYEIKCMQFYLCMSFSFDISAIIFHL